MARLRTGSPTSFWNNVAAGANSVSTAITLSRSAEHLAIYVTTGGATTITVEVAHFGSDTSEGVEPEGAAGTWHQLMTGQGATATPVQHVFAGAGSAAFIISDMVPLNVRLKTSGAVTLTAGHETVNG